MLEPFSAPVGIVVALEREASTLTLCPSRKVRPLRLTEGSWLSVSGMGAERAEQAAFELLACGCCTLVSWGTAGALDPELKAGELILPESVMTESGEIYKVDEAWHIYLRRLLERDTEVSLGNLLTISRVITSPSEKRILKERTSAVAVDMEGAAVAKAAAAARTPFIAVKTAVDLANQGLPAWLTHSLDPWGRVRPGCLIRNSVHARFRDGALLWQLARNFRCAHEQLVRVARTTDRLSVQGFKSNASRGDHR